MACYSPIKAWRGKEFTSPGKRKIVFNPKEAYLDMPIEIACGQCSGCRLERSRQWAVRCIHEASLYSDNCFITLTYNDENLPKDNSLDLQHFQLFIKKIRKKYGAGIRYFHCGEYGDLLNRPHYHACIFNFRFPDERIYKVSGGNKLYNSKIANDIWEKGFVVIGEVTFKSAAYVARYIMKKVTGKKADDHYKGKKPEYVTMSRRPGIGKNWFDKYHQEAYRDDYIIVNGKKTKIPRYYDNQMADMNESLVESLKARRSGKAERHKENNSDDRLLVRSKIQDLKINKLKRSIHDHENIFDI